MLKLYKFLNFEGVHAKKLINITCYLYICGVTQGLPFPMQPNHGGSFQAILNQAALGNNAIARGDEWWGNQPPN